MDIAGRTTCDHIVGNSPVGYTLLDCPRCGGKGTYGGFTLTKEGDVPTVSGVDYLRQTLEKVFIEKKRPSGYGFDYDVLIGLGSNASLMNVQREVQRTVLYLKNQQQANKKTGVIYSPNEEIYDVKDIRVAFNTAEPRRIDITLIVIALSGRSIDLSSSLER
jgi:hypothetical protein